MPCVEICERWTCQPQAGCDPFAWPGRSPFALLYGGDWTLFGEEPLLELADLRIPELAFRRSGPVPDCRPDFMGFASYEAGYALDPLLPPPPADPWGFPRVAFVLYRHLRLHHAPTGRLFEAWREGPAPGGGEHLLETGPFRARKRWDSDACEGYAAKVARIREEIGRGNVYQVNLTRQEAWDFEGSLLELARRLWAANPAPFSGLVAGRDHAVLSSSPERFLALGEGRLESWPIKGTAPRGSRPEEDLALALALEASPKDRAELAMIVDLVRNDLARVCSLPSVGVEAFPRLETYANVHHLVATVAGLLRSGTDLEALFRALFPAGSITGCPKLAAMGLIRELEAHPRLAYTGALGWFAHDLSRLDLAVAIRTCSAARGELRFGVGGGVVWDSDPRAEYEETVVKGRSLVQCLSS